MIPLLQGYRCIKTNRLSQEFGSNNACIRRSDGRVVGKRNGVCPSGFVSFYDDYLRMKGHNGRDWASIRGEYVYHSWNFIGIVKTEVDIAGGIGVNIISLSPVKLRDGRLAHVKVKSWHNLENLVYDGQIVRMGDVIARSNSTGASSGNHVHEGVKEIRLDTSEDAKWRPMQDRFLTVNGGNGYRGAIDPRPYQENLFIGEAVQILEEFEGILIKAKRILLQLQTQLRNLGKGSNYQLEQKYV